jgi:glutathione peroxidase
MKSKNIIIMLAILLLFVAGCSNLKQQKNMNSEFYNFSALSIDGKEIKMDAYKGKYVLIVNTASKCGFTPQYAGLEVLNQKYKDKGLVILGFPCNQFGGQEPGDEKSIEEGCMMNYGVTFQMFSKVDVNGKNAHPLFKYLKSELKGILGGRIKWNFTKFLVDPNGNPVKRFPSTETPEEIGEYLQTIIK